MTSSSCSPETLAKGERRERHEGVPCLCKHFGEAFGKCMYERGDSEAVFKKEDEMARLLF